MMRIAILGWGSLIWNPNGLPIRGDWQRGGPVLPIEFSRISSDERLTLVIDEQNGINVTTRYALSARTNTKDTIEDLRLREGTISRWIGHIVSSQNEGQQSSVTTIMSWARDREIDSVVWTALPSNFEEKTGNTLSVEHAMTYLQGLPQQTRQRALDYIRNAPEEVNTPIRRAVTCTFIM